MKKERKELVERASKYIKYESTIANGLLALYLQADASLLQLMRVKQRMESVLQGSGATTKENPELDALKNYYTAVKQAEYFFDKFISKIIIDATYGSNEGKDKVASYDNWMACANDFARMSLLFLDRTYNDFEQLKKIFDFLEGLEGHGQFDENDFKYFKIDYPDE